MLWYRSPFLMITACLSVFWLVPTLDRVYNSLKVPEHWCVFLLVVFLDAKFCAAFRQSSAVHVWGRIWCCCPETRTETFQHMHISHRTKAYECANWAQVTTVKHAGWPVFSLTHSGLIKQQNGWLALYLILAKNSPLINRKRTCLFCLYMLSCVNRFCFTSHFEVVIINLLHSGCWKE